MPMGMSSLLTAPLVADIVVEDSVSFNLALYNLKSLGFPPFKSLSHYPKKQKKPLPALLIEVLIILALLGVES